MIFLHVFTEEESAKILFDSILPKILPNNIPFQVYKHQGKQDLERGLRKVLPSISKIPGSRILITRDQDSASCYDVKAGLNQIAFAFCHCPYLIRIICTELEAWFLGDLDAISFAYPRFNGIDYKSKADFRQVDQINSPNELLLKIIPEYSGRNYLPKLEVAKNISPNMILENNRSSSFQNTIRAIKILINE